MIDVVAAIALKGSKVLIARRANNQSLPGKWEFPGGKIEAEETPKESLEREIEEEFGVKSEVGAHLTSVEHDYGNFSIRLHAYFVTLQIEPAQSSDHDKIEWVEVENILRLDLAEADIPIAQSLQNAIAKKWIH